MKYSVKIIIKHAVESGEVFLEESIIMVDAASFDDAYFKAEQYVKDNEICSSYENINGKRVQSEVVSYADCFSVYDDEDVIEVYSSIIKCSKDLPEDAIVKYFEKSSSRKELLPLRRYLDSEQPDETNDDI